MYILLLVSITSCSICMQWVACVNFEIKNIWWRNGEDRSCYLCSILHNIVITYKLKRTSVRQQLSKCDYIVGVGFPLRQGTWRAADANCNLTPLRTRVLLLNSKQFNEQKALTFYVMIAWMRACAAALCDQSPTDARYDCLSLGQPRLDGCCCCCCAGGPRELISIYIGNAILECGADRCWVILFLCAAHATTQSPSPSH